MMQDVKEALGSILPSQRAFGLLAALLRRTIYYGSLVVIDPWDERHAFGTGEAPTPCPRATFRRTGMPTEHTVVAVFERPAQAEEALRERAVPSTGAPQRNISAFVLNGGSSDQHPESPRPLQRQPALCRFGDSNAAPKHYPTAKAHG
jgi:hypothetical protein